MVIYNPKDWFSLIFRFHKSDTFRRLFWVMMMLGVYTAGVAYVELEVLKVPKHNTMLIYQLLGFVISLLLVFRTNTAYERWWEGRKQWGALVNSSRNLGLKTEMFIAGRQEERREFLHLLKNYADALKEHLRGRKIAGFPVDKHQPNFIAKKMYGILNSWYKEGAISGEQLIVFDAELKTLTEICGACERIRKSPIPFSYSLFIKKFIFVYVMSMPFAFVAEFGYVMVPIVVFVFYVLGSLELIAEEIEDPFGEDANDLPTDELVDTIVRSVGEMEE